VPLVLRTRLISATVAHLVHAYHVLSIKKWSERRSLERVLSFRKGAMGVLRIVLN